MGVLSYLGLVVLEPMGFVHHQAGPVDGAQHGRVDGDELVGRQQHVELHRGVLLLTPPGLGVGKYININIYPFFHASIFFLLVPLLQSATDNSLLPDIK